MVKSGFFVNLNIDANTIKSVKATRNPLSAPAISLDRLEIAYGKYDTIMVSPKDRTGFIAQLLNDHPSIAVELTK
ncbi:PH domain-containing protein [Mucilaginibacter daejeonensis]|uniref:PH domain-containing protein n=1 Tax=Mucilaginibacter daejeonensis TaxID=398049 RepID=UPI001D176872|nr:PH domain-containing protein [Mucilaginibacter daejeonensis]UEG55384.1 PH domain-containing protein [Mucilaginibacter daejeonensis]